MTLRTLGDLLDLTDDEVEIIAADSGCYYTTVDRKNLLLVLRPSLYRFARALLEAKEKELRDAGRLSD